MNGNAIELVSQARALLERATKPAEWKDIMRLASGAKAFLRGRDDAHAAWLAAGEIELRAKKRLADYISAQPKAKSANPKPPIGGSVADHPIYVHTLEDLGISKGWMAQEYRALAAVDPDVFETRLRDTVDAGRAPSVASVTSVSADPDYDGDSWCTPSEWIERARQVMGSIDTDPASNPGGQRVVKATTYYTKETNGLDKPWKGNVWLNPPYSTALMRAFADRVLVRDFDQAIILTNNCTDSAWWHDLARAAALHAQTKGRISFLHPKHGEAFATRQGQTFFYFGAKSERFAEVFGEACSVFWGVE